jgi:ubiquinone/menaquinone biosynthesis C-methylase UbiE
MNRHNETLFSAGFLQRQADRTRNHRLAFYRLIGLANLRNALEVGCGPGLILAEIKRRSSLECHGIDVDDEAIAKAQQAEPELKLEIGTADRLPFQDSSFDLTFTHFALMWQKETLRVLSEMVRVTHHGGWVAALAEPDYGGLVTDGTEQEEGLEEQALLRLGAKTRIGRKLLAWFRELNLRDIQAGVLGATLDCLLPDTLLPTNSHLIYLPIFWAWGKKT